TLFRSESTAHIDDFGDLRRKAWVLENGACDIGEWADGYQFDLTGIFIDCIDQKIDGVPVAIRVGIIQAINPFIRWRLAIFVFVNVGPFRRGVGIDLVARIWSQIAAPAGDGADLQFSRE